MRRASFVSRTSTLLALLLAWPLAATTPAQATAGLPAMTQLLDMDNVVLDRPDGWLLISGGELALGQSIQAGVQVTDLQGRPVASLLPTHGIVDVEIAPDGRSAWAADVTTGALDQISLPDLTVRAFPLPHGDVPTGVTPVSSRWIVFTSTGPAGSVGVLDTSSGSVWQPASGLGSHPTLRLIPSTRRVLDVDGTHAAIYDFATGRPVQTASGTLAVPCQLVDLAVAPDGQSFVPACADDVRITEYSTTSFAVRARYFFDRGLDPVSVPYIEAVAYSGDGNLLAIGQEGQYANNFSVLKRSGSGWQGYYGKHLAYESVTDQRGVVFGPDSTTIYVLGQYLGGKESSPVTIEAATGTPAPVPTPTALLSVSSPTTSYVGDTVSVDGSLRFSDTADSDAGADRAITITRTLNGVGITVATTTDVHGNFSFKNTPTAAGVATYSVNYAGDELHPPTSAVTTTRLAKHTTQLTIAVTNVDEGDNGIIYHVLAHLGPTYTNRTVTITENTEVLVSGVVNANGDITGSSDPQQCDFSFPCYLNIKATFAGDARYLPAEADLA